MATYLEIRGLYRSGSDLANRTEFATVVAAELIRAGDDNATAGFSEAAEAHDKRKLWAVTAFHENGGTASALLRAVLAQNRASTVEQITGASDAVLQTAVNKAVDLLAGN